MELSVIFSNLASLDWGTLANIAVILSAIFLISQLREMRLTTLAQSYSVARDIIQDAKVREARLLIFELDDAEKTWETWSKEEIDAAQTICHTYDSVGQMVQHKLLKKSIIIKSWGPSLRRSWQVLEPLVLHYRKSWHAAEVWDDFEWLAVEAAKYQRKQERINRRKRLFKRLLRWEQSPKTNE